MALRYRSTQSLQRSRPNEFFRNQVYSHERFAYSQSLMTDVSLDVDEVSTRSTSNMAESPDRNRYWAVLVRVAVGTEAGTALPAYGHVETLGRTGLRLGF